jgi:methanogenic corrinoid protein MtbC1
VPGLATAALLDPFLAALVDRDRAAVERIAERLERDDVPAAVVYSSVFAPALQRIGELWAAGDISIAQEHVASSLVETLMARTYPRAFVAARASRERIVMACVAGERHVLGLRMAADLLEGAGFDVVALGSDTAVPVLLEAVERHGPAAVVLAAETDESVASLREAMEALDKSASRSVPVLVGGASQAIRENLGLDRAVTVVDDVADATAAVERALALGPA